MSYDTADADDAECWLDWFICVTALIPYRQIVRLGCGGLTILLAIPSPAILDLQNGTAEGTGHGVSRV